MSENQTVMENPYEEREELFRSPEQMTMKIRIVDEEARKLFPELARDLEVNGLINDVCIDEDGYIHDGLKRVRLLGLEQIKGLGKLKLVPKDSKCENVPLTKKDRMQHLKWSYEYLSQNAKFGDKVKIADVLAKRYGVSRRTVYMWIENNTEPTFAKIANLHKPRKNKCDNCLKVQSLTEENNRLREQYQKVVGYPEEVVASDEFRLVKAISLFMEKHPNKEFTPDGKIMEKLT